MPSCLLLGDSIAIGLQKFMVGCTFVAGIGVNTPTMVHRLENTPALHDVVYDVAVVSLGSNDRIGGIRLEMHLTVLQRRVPARRIIFVLPALEAQRASVARIAEAFGHSTVSFEPGKDGVHPNSYAVLAMDVRRAL